MISSENNLISFIAEKSRQEAIDTLITTKLVPIQA